jgi:hypothetical protein
MSNAGGVGATLNRYSDMLAGNAFYNPNSFASIATQTVTSGTASSITFSSIPQTYKHLQLRLLANNNDTGGSGVGNVRCSGFFNGDTTQTNYYNHYLYGDGYSAGAGAENTAKWIMSATRNSMIAPGIAIADILDYTNTNKYKTARALWGWDNNDGNNSSVRLLSGLWSNTSAITSITITPESGAFKAYSSFALYGVN